jgi:hypothetical protein
MLVNANAKLKGVVGSSVNQAAIQIYTMVIAHVVDDIFHVPKEVRDQIPSLFPPVPALPSAHYPSVGTPGTTSEFGRESNIQAGQHSMDLDRHDSGVVEEGHSDFIDHFEDDDSEEDNEPDTINGLTFSEMGLSSSEYQMARFQTLNEERLQC